MFFTIPIANYQRTSFDLASRQAEWNAAYASVNLTEERQERLHPGYARLVQEALARVGQRTDLKDVRAIELACGSAPWCVYLRDKGIQTECADYAEVLIHRLRTEDRLPAVQLNLAELSAVPADRYDLIVMAGGIYEDPNPNLARNVYQDVGRLLRPGGVFVQFLNRYLNVGNLLHTWRCNVQTFGSPRFWPLVRRAFGKPLLPIGVRFWLLPVPLVLAWGRAASLDVVQVRYLGRCAGILFEKSGCERSIESSFS